MVVGGGAIGVCCALELARRGAAVTLLERGEELASGASSGNAGLLCPSHSAPIANPASLRNGLRWMLSPDSPFFLRPRPSVAPWLARFVRASTASRAAEGTRIIRELSLAGLELHAELARDGLATGFERRGILNVYETEAAFAEARAHADGIGVPAHVLDRDETRRLEPAVGERIAGGVYFPDEAHCDPLAFVYSAGRAAKEAGATIETHVEVRSLRRANGGIAVDTSKGTLRARTVVLAAGAWTTALAEPLGVCLPQEGGKGYHLDLEPTKADPQVPISMDEAHVIATPLPGRLRLSGTLELAGLDTSISRRRRRRDPRRCRARARDRRGAARARGLGGAAAVHARRPAGDRPAGRRRAARARDRPRPQGAVARPDHGAARRRALRGRAAEHRPRPAQPRPLPAAASLDYAAELPRPGVVEPARA